ncbi:teichuronic acid biosynthesis protein TuaH [Sporolactobacillus putidus]|uniref:Teichuronic acid biosynthesis glycosyltransferase TuaH n=1 Tax=Sporolactobacillus putidus TaxID=492735 RepID=A0A917S524_9BACL|nr:glycosyltransferase [Sporolactobacillus putidus]GGL58672.1 putative teichuronic acid biosynthesis glycosyltransferase TuaH [Sporolactobacillus putidus]
MKNIHIIVATGVWEQDRLRYRRHRLAEFLQNESDTQEVIWLCPAPRRVDPPRSRLANGISQWTVQDLFPHRAFRFGRYVDIFHRRRLRPLLSYIRARAAHHRFYLWFTFPGFPLLGDLFPWTRVIYDCSDLWASPISGRPSAAAHFRQYVIAKAEQRIIDRAGIIFCTSDYLHDQVVKKLGAEKTKRVFTFENGVEFDRFSGRTQAADVLPENFGGTVLGYIGGIKPKLDFNLIEQVAEKKSGWLFLFVGPDGTGRNREFQQLLMKKNVLWTGSVSPEDISQYMNLVDVGIMPYKLSPYNEAVFPLKLFEFLAAGKPAVGVHLPSTKKYAEEGVYAYLDNSDPGSFIRACEQMAGSKNQEAAINRRLALAKSRNWHDIFQHMTDLVINHEKSK